MNELFDESKLFSGFMNNMESNKKILKANLIMAFLCGFIAYFFGSYKFMIGNLIILFAVLVDVKYIMEFVNNMYNFLEILAKSLYKILLTLLQHLKRVANFLVANYQLSKKIKGSFFMFVYLIIYWKILGKHMAKLNLEYKGKKFVFYVDNRMDLAVLTEIFVNEEYEFDYASKEPKIILDLGANVGDTAIFYALKYPEAKIYAIEPNPNIYDKLIKNTEQFANIKICKCAVSDKTGKINLYFGDSHLGSSINMREQNKNSVEVDVLTLPDFCKNESIEKIDILKFDIEGAEEYLLKSEFIKTNVSEIAGEMHDDLVSTPLKPMLDNLNLKNKVVKQLNTKRYIVYGKIDLA
jgi:FkbM family methyltransferase